MELQISFSHITFLSMFLVFLAILIREYKRFKPSPQKAPMKLPPGPWKLPLIGNIHQLIGAGLPHHALRKLAKNHGPDLMHLKLGKISVLVVSSPRVAKEVFKTHDIRFADRPALLAVKILFYNRRDLAFTPYGDYWRQIRKICVLELLSTKNVRSYRSIREEEVWELASSISSRSGSCPVNLTQSLFSLATSIIWRTSIGQKFASQDEFIKLSREAVSMIGGHDVADLFPSLKFLHPMSRMKPRLLKVRDKAGKIMGSLINERREARQGGFRAGNENVLDVLLKLQQSNQLEFPITDDNIKAIIFDMFLAGSDTAAVTTDWAMSEMIKNPRVMEKATAEVRLAFQGKERIHENDIEHEDLAGRLSYIKLVIKETLRLHPPAPLLLPRECREACEIDGYTIPVKSQVLINAWAIGRDPDYWHDPEVFVPERFENSGLEFGGNSQEYIPFGGGRRMCPGMPFSVAIVELALATLLYHFDYALPKGVNLQDLDMTETSGCTSTRMNDLLVLATPYSA